MKKVMSICKTCESKYFDLKGVIILRGFNTFVCFNCGERSGNFIVGQHILCHKCSEKLGECIICGKQL